METRKNTWERKKIVTNWLENIPHGLLGRPLKWENHVCKMQCILLIITVHHKYKCSCAVECQLGDRLTLYSSQDRGLCPDLGMTVNQTVVRTCITSRLCVLCRTPHAFFPKHEFSHFPSDVQCAWSACVCFKVEENRQILVIAAVDSWGSWSASGLMADKSIKVSQSTAASCSVDVTGVHILLPWFGTAETHLIISNTMGILPGLRLSVC